MSGERPENDGPALDPKKDTTPIAGETPARSSVAQVQTVQADDKAGNGGGAASPNPGTALAPAAGSIRVSFAGRTSVGLVREHNEDNFVVANLTNGERHPRDVTRVDEVGATGLMFAVCDGMGGAAAGEVASQMAVDILYEALRRGGAPANRDALARRLVSAVEEAGKRIYEAAQRERSRRGMGTTATVAVLVDKVLFLAEVGDSRAYLLRRGELKQLTKDQSLVNQLIEAGHLTEQEAEAFEHSNIILQALGTAESVQVDLTFVELREGDRILMCSDGLSGLVHGEVLRETLAAIEAPDAACAKLVELAEGAGGHDNITVLVAGFAGGGLDAPRETDNFGYMQYPLPLGEDEGGAFTDEDTTSSGVAAAAAPVERVPGAIEAVEGPSAAVWLAGGGVALAAAAAVWFAVESRKPEAVPEIEAPMQEAHEVVREESPSVGAALVPVQVHTDIEGAVLFVNGEPRGDLSTSAGRSVSLLPGVHKLEARADGNPVADTLLEVKANTPPVDVFLRLPIGASDDVPEREEAEEKVLPGEQPEDEPAEEPEAPAEPPPQAAERAPAPAPGLPTTPAPIAKPAPSAPTRPTEPAVAIPTEKPVEVRPAPAPTPTPAPEPVVETAPKPVVRPKPVPKTAPTRPVEAAPSAPAAPAPPPAPKDIPDNPF